MAGGVRAHTVAAEGEIEFHCVREADRGRAERIVAHEARPGDVQARGCGEECCEHRGGWIAWSVLLL